MQNLSNLLTVPTGKIERGPYWLGVVALVLATAILGLAPLLGPVLAIAALWPWYCLLTKRCRDMAGDPRLVWLALIPLGLSAAISAVLQLTALVPLATLTIFTLAGVLGSVVLFTGLAGLAVVIWFGVSPGRHVLDA